MTRIAINGMGRIGRMIARIFVTNPPEGMELVAANDLYPVESIAYLTKYDSVHGRAPFKVRHDDNNLCLGDSRIRMFKEREPEKIPWGDLGVDVVMECTGAFRDRNKAAGHLRAGASRVIISAPSDTADLTLVPGVNDGQYDASRHEIISIASCTTNSLAPVSKVLNDSFGIDHLMATTIHAYTASQKLIDAPARKIRRGRAATMSLVPTTTGASKATCKVIPELEGKMHALAVRAPIPDGALTDITADLGRDVTVEEVNSAFRYASEGSMKGILGYSEEPLVSIDIVGDSRSSIIDAEATMVLGDRTVKVLAWYDNEYGFSCRMLDTAAFLSREGTARAMKEAPLRA